MRYKLKRWQKRTALIIAGANVISLAAVLILTAVSSHIARSQEYNYAAERAAVSRSRSS